MNAAPIEKILLRIAVETKLAVGNLATLSRFSPAGSWPYLIGSYSGLVSTTTLSLEPATLAGFQTSEPYFTPNRTVL